MLHATGDGEVTVSRAEFVNLDIDMDAQGRLVANNRCTKPLPTALLEAGGPHSDSDRLPTALLEAGGPHSDSSGLLASILLSMAYPLYDTLLQAGAPVKMEPLWGWGVARSWAHHALLSQLERDAAAQADAEVLRDRGTEDVQRLQEALAFMHVVRSTMGHLHSRMSITVV
jgi:hypothetical protein